MIKILEIQYLNKKKAKVLFEERPSLILYSGELEKLGWREGSAIDEKVYDGVRSDTVEKRAKLYAMHLLEDRDRTEKELTDKLISAGYDPEIALAALNYVKKFGYVNDENYAVRYLEVYSGRKSRRTILLELKKRGIDANTIEDAFAGRDFEEDEYQAIFNLLRKRRYDPLRFSEEDDPQAARKERDRQLRYLASKGFSYASARYVFEHWDELEER